MREPLCFDLIKIHAEAYVKVVKKAESIAVSKTTVAQDVHQRRIFDFRPPSKSIAFTLDWVTILTWDFFPAKIEFLIDDLKLVSSIYLKRFACGNDLKFDLAKKVSICSLPKNT